MTDQDMHERSRYGWTAGAAAAAAVVTVALVVLPVTGDERERLAQVSTAASSDVVVTAALTAASPVALEVEVGPVGAGDTSWRVHDLTLTNTSAERLLLDDARFSRLLPGEQLFVGMGCGYGIVDGRVTEACFASYSPRMLAAGQSTTYAVALWRDLPGMSALTSGRYALEVPLRLRATEPFDGGEDSDGASTAVVTLTYAVTERGDPPAAANRFIGLWRAPDGSPAEQGTGQQRTYEVATQRMPEHCDWQSAVSLHVPWPLGSTYVIGPDAVPTRHYVRDPEGVFAAFPAAFRGELDLDATLPEDSRRTGYRLDDVELWLGPDDGEDYAYLVRPENVERWPREAELIGCA
jgi:hypothetical protein